MSIATPGLLQEVLQAIIDQVRDIVVGATDLMGVPLNIDVYASYALRQFENPAIYVALEPSAMAFTPGMNLLVQNDDGTYTSGLEMPGSRIVLDVVALSPAQRFRIVDLLITGILNSTATLPDGTVLDSAFIRALGQQGITVYGVEVESQPPQETDSRQKGDVFRGTLTLSANIWLNWTPAQRTAPSQVNLVVGPDLVDIATQPSLDLVFTDLGPDIGPNTGPNIN